MQRRTLLQSAAPALVLGLAGCSDDGDGDGDGDDGGSQMINLKPIEQSREDVDEPIITELSVEYDYRTEFAVRPDEAGMFQADGETQNLVFQLRVHNEGEGAIDVGPDSFQAANDDSVFAYYDTDDPDQFPRRRLDPGDVANGWLAYEITANVTELFFVVRQSQYDGGVVTSFEENEDLEFTIDDGETGTTVPPDDDAGTTAADDGTTTQAGE